MTPEELQALLDQADEEQAREELAHSPWATLRWFANDTTSSPEGYGPFPSAVEALSCADTLRRQLDGALLGDSFRAAHGEPIVHIVPLYLDYDG